MYRYLFSEHGYRVGVEHADDINDSLTEDRGAWREGCEHCAIRSLDANSFETFAPIIGECAECDSAAE